LPPVWNSSTKTVAARVFAFGSRPDKNGDGLNSNNGSGAVDMRSVGIKHLKNKLGEYIRLAAEGETVLVTDRDRLVAELGPPAPAGAHWFRMRFCSMPFARGGLGHRYRLDGKCRPENR
jgi:antitoxin (DNA-binding transcriptional repressor) of toxin-antitoxin stability system